MVPVQFLRVATGVLLAVGLLAACSEHRSTQEQQLAKGGPETGTLLGSAERLLPMPTAEQLTQYKVAAYAGSGTAANALSVFYAKAAPDGEAELYWTMIGAENGDAVAQFNLATLYLQKERGHYSLQRAKYWLNQSASQGSVQAKDLLEDVEAGRPVP